LAGEAVRASFALGRPQVLALTISVRQPETGLRSSSVAHAGASLIAACARRQFSDYRVHALAKAWQYIPF
jgi:hypothetical protein